MRPTICLDLDGVLAEYHGWRGIEHIGEPIEGAVEFSKQLAEFAKIIVYTTRCKEYPGNTPAPPGAAAIDRRCVEELACIVERWLKKHGFAYDEIYTGQGKPFAVCYIDDRAITCQPQEFEPAFAYGLAVKKAKQSCDKLRKQDISPTLQQDSEAKP